MSNWISPTVKQLWNYGTHELHNFFGFNKHNSFLLVSKQPSSPKELHGQSEGCFEQFFAPFRTSNVVFFVTIFGTVVVVVVVVPTTNLNDCVTTSRASGRLDLTGVRTSRPHGLTGVRTSRPHGVTTTLPGL